MDPTPPKKQNKKCMYVFTRVLTYHHFFPTIFFLFQSNLDHLCSHCSLLIWRSNDIITLLIELVGTGSQCLHFMF